MIHRIDVSRKDDLFAHLRQMVEAGFSDAPVEVHYDGKHCLNVASLYRAALLNCVEEPRLRLVSWAPHPKFGKPPGPRMAALLADRDARIAAKKAAKA